MGINLLRTVEKFQLAPEGRESFLNNLKELVQCAADQPESFPFHPEHFWPEDLTKWDPDDRDRLLYWLGKEAKEAAVAATKHYDYLVAPTTIEDLEEEVIMMQLAAAIYRVQQLYPRYHFSIVRTDEHGYLYRTYPDGRIEYIKKRKRSQK